MNIVYFSLGSNQGNRIKNLKQSVESIQIQIGELIDQSSYFETEPWGFSSEIRFINQVISIKTNLSVRQVLQKILRIEEVLGRTRLNNPQLYCNRIIDVDILFYDDTIYSDNDLVVPHRFIPERRFVLEPLNEIAPDFVHPLLKQPVKELLQKCSDQLKVVKLVPTETLI